MVSGYGYGKNDHGIFEVTIPTFPRRETKENHVKRQSEQPSTQLRYKCKAFVTTPTWPELGLNADGSIILKWILRDRI
jgi:hypothetical protein